MHIISITLSNSIQYIIFYLNSFIIKMSDKLKKGDDVDPFKKI
jgi:hypothetical protein